MLVVAAAAILFFPVPFEDPVNHSTKSVYINSKWSNVSFKILCDASHILAAKSYDQSQRPKPLLIKAQSQFEIKTNQTNVSFKTFFGVSNILVAKPYKRPKIMLKIFLAQSETLTVWTY